MLPLEIIYEIFYFLDIDTRHKNKIPPNKLNSKQNTFSFIKPKLSIFNNYIINELSDILIITDLDLLDTIIIIKNKEMYTYSSKFIHSKTIISNRLYTLQEFI